MPASAADGAEIRAGKIGGGPPDADPRPVDDEKGAEARFSR
jgi:hypothetical protein